MPVLAKNQGERGAVRMTMAMICQTNPTSHFRETSPSIRRMSILQAPSIEKEPAA
jgi:hypothetical protein